MKKKLAILLSISLLACSFGMAGCAAQKETKTSSAETSREPSTSAAEPSESTPTETSQPSPSSTPEPSQASQETPKGTLTASPEVKEKYGNFVYYDSIENAVNYEYPSITQEQFDQIIALRIGNSATSMPYQEGVITGTIDPSAPRLTLEKVKEIIADAKSRELESDKSIKKLYHMSVLDYPNCCFGYIYSEISKIQPPDIVSFSDPSKKAYYLSVNEDGVPIEQIILSSNGATYGISHCILNDDGEGCKVDEVLYEPM